MNIWIAGLLVLVGGAAAVSCIFGFAVLLTWLSGRGRFGKILGGVLLAAVLYALALLAVAESFVA